MEKYLLVDVEHQRGGEPRSRSVLLEGDHRQTNQRMVEKLVEKWLDPDYETTEEDDTYRHGDATMQMKNVESVSPSEAEDLRSSNFTLVVNEHVTEPACRVSYSGPASIDA